MFWLVQPFSYSAGVLLQVTTGELEICKVASAVLVCVLGQLQQILDMYGMGKNSIQIDLAICVF